jgi:hypothetical protein
MVPAARSIVRLIALGRLGEAVLEASLLICLTLARTIGG